MLILRRIIKKNKKIKKKIKTQLIVLYLEHIKMSVRVLAQRDTNDHTWMSALLSCWMS